LVYAVDVVNGKMLDAMKASGCFLISYGLESYSKKVLQSMKKAIGPEQIHQAIHETLNRGISIQGNFIFGDPVETLDTAMETLEFWRAHREAGIQLGNIVACPDSQIYQYCLSRKIIKNKLHFIKYHLFDFFNMTQMPKRKFQKLLDLIFLYQLKYSFCVVPEKIDSESIVIRCPHCAKTIQYNNFRIRGIFYKQVMYCRSCRKRFYAVSAAYVLYSRFSGFALLFNKFQTKFNKLRGVLFIMFKSSPFIWRVCKDSRGYFYGLKYALLDVLKRKWCRKVPAL
jgi:radical SAM superfamily enzyme YgiQ (UPF0313 family)